MSKMAVPSKDKVRNLIVELVMSDWNSKVLARLYPRLKAYVKAQYPDAEVVLTGKIYALTGVDNIKCTMNSERGVWALAARELAR